MIYEKRYLLLEDRKFIKNLEISDYYGFMNWFKANEACKEKGNGWRLPKLGEVKFLSDLNFLNYRVPWFGSTFWCLTDVESVGYAYYFFTSDGYYNLTSKFSVNHVFFVREY